MAIPVEAGVALDAVGGRLTWLGCDGSASIWLMRGRA
jgi:hypothetical protein